jgi:serine/threonine protein kinase/Tfp pilus assembly protein PilF
MTIQGEAVPSGSVVAAALARPCGLLPRDLALEFKELWKRGQRIAADDFLSRYPELNDDPSIVQELAYEEYLQRLLAGETPDLERFCARFGAFQTSLQELIQLHHFLENQADSAPANLPAGWPKPGDTFFDFVLLRELGRGSFARAFLASQPALGDRRVVLKVSLGGATEAETLGRLNHPNVVPVHSVQQDPTSGLTAVCMPYLGTATLANVVDRVFTRGAFPARARVILEAAREGAPDGDLPPHPEPPARMLQQGTYLDGILHVAAQLADALAFVHKHGVCHRDLKPSNVLLSPHGKPMLLDFNLSSDARTAGPRVGGTVRYMAPEQLRTVEAGGGDTSSLDARSDLYSFGVILYELLSGSHPFGMATPSPVEPETCSHWRERQREGPRPLRQANPRVDRALARVIERCLAPDPNDRPTSAAELASALRKSLTPGRRLHRWVTRHAVVTLVVTCLAAAAALGGGYALATRLPYPERQLHLGVQAQRRGDYAEAIVYLNRALDADPNLRPALFARAHARQQLAEQLPADERTAQLSQALADYYRADALAPDPKTWACIAYCQSSLKQHRQAIGNYERSLAGGYVRAAVHNDLGYSQLHLGGKRLDEARRHLDQAISLDPRLQVAYHNRAMALLLIALRDSVPILESAIGDITLAIRLGPVTADLYHDAACICALAARHDERWSDQALEFLGQAFDQGLDRQHVHANPLFSALKNNHHFLALLRKPALGPPTQAVRLVDPVDGSSD